MKQLLTILLFLPFFISCSSDDDGAEKAKTIIQVKNNTDKYFNRLLLAYKDGDIYKKIGNIDFLSVNKTSDKFYMDDIADNVIYIFTDYGSFELHDTLYWRIIDSTYLINHHHENLFNIESSTKMKAVNTLDEREFPIR